MDLSTIGYTRNASRDARFAWLALDSGLLLRMNGMVGCVPSVPGVRMGTSAFE